VGDVYWQYGALQYFYNMWEICTGSMVHYSSCIICGRCVLAVWCITVLVYYVGDVYWQYGALQFLYNMWEMCTGIILHYSSCVICKKYVLAVWCITFLE